MFTTHARDLCDLGTTNQAIISPNITQSQQSGNLVNLQCLAIDIKSQVKQPHCQSNQSVQKRCLLKNIGVLLKN